MTYFEWLVSVIEVSNTGQYVNLLHKLYARDYFAQFALDQNRLQDGIDLYYYYNPAGPAEQRCSVLAMLVALAVRIENEYMATATNNRTGLWFWSMIYSMGLDKYDDLHWNENAVDDILNRFMNHQYEINGSGGLFTVPKTKYDMRTLQIWDQMQQWLLSNF